MTNEPDLAAWLLEQIAEDGSQHWAGDGTPDAVRAIRERDAKRRIVERYRNACIRSDTATDPVESETWATVAGAFEECLQLLALPYADRPGYREEWRP